VREPKPKYPMVTEPPERKRRKRYQDTCGHTVNTRSKDGVSAKPGGQGGPAASLSPRTMEVGRRWDGTRQQAGATGSVEGSPSDRWKTKMDIQDGVKVPRKLEAVAHAYNPSYWGG
jgi:hypothetical protein